MPSVLPESPLPGSDQIVSTFGLAEMAIVCILMNHFNLSYQKAENAVASWNLDLNGLVPDHTAIFRAHAALDMEWLEVVLTTVANACLERAWIGEASEVDTAADSTGEGRQARRQGKDGQKDRRRPQRAKSHPELRLSAVSKQIDLSAVTAPGSVADAGVPPSL